jgi:hypothetical protein
MEWVVSIKVFKWREEARCCQACPKSQFIIGYSLTPLLY